MLLGNDGVIKLADFGQAKRITSTGTGSTGQKNPADAVDGARSGAATAAAAAAVSSSSSSSSAAAAASESGPGESLKGTPLWMAPEVISEQHMTRGWRKADIW